MVHPGSCNFHHALVMVLDIVVHVIVMVLDIVVHTIILATNLLELDGRIFIGA